MTEIISYGYMFNNAIDFGKQVRPTNISNADSVNSSNFVNNTFHIHKES